MKSILTAVLLLLLPAGAALAQNDVVEFIIDDPNSCCFKFSVSNEHDPPSPIDRVRLSVVTPDVTMQPGANNPWPISVWEDTMIVYGEEGYQLDENDVLEEFSVCFDRAASSASRFRVVWRTMYMDEVVSMDTVELECEDAVFDCDSVTVVPVTLSGQAPGTCCYEFTLHNVNISNVALDGLQLQTFSPGVEIVGTPTGPWRIAEQTTRSVTFRTTPDSLGSGESLGGFRVCVRTQNSAPGPVRFVWRTMLRELLICEGLVSSTCTPHQETRCDSLLLSEGQDCTWDFGFRNRHTPPSGVNGFRVTVLTPDAGLDTAYAPAGWRVSARTARAVTFTSVAPAGVAANDSLRGFGLRFAPSVTGSFEVAWCTLRNDTALCCDTVALFCEPSSQAVCDSLLVTRQGASCTYDFGFVNAHEPASGVNSFTVRARTSGARILDATPPAPWYVAFQGPREVIFRDSTGVVPPSGSLTGFYITFSAPASGTSIEYLWCTGLDTLTHCCQSGIVECEVQEERCDSLSVTRAAAYCSYSFGLTNLHVPVSGVDGFSVRLTGPETLIRDAAPPAGWLIEEETQTEIRFRKIGAPLPNGTGAEDFVLDLLPSATDTRIPLTMATLLGDSVLCSDTTTVFCAFALVQCDTVDVITSAERPCCFEFELRNGHLPLSAVEGFTVEILTPDVVFYSTTVDEPEGWLHVSDERTIRWSSRSAVLQPGMTLGGFVVCYDNDATGNADFRIAWRTLNDGDVLCADTLTIKCDRTLEVDLLPGAVPGQFLLHQNYPNPFNPVTTIMFDVPHPADLTLSLYDSQGRLVMDLGSRHYLAGRYRITLDASDLPSGTYFYRMRSATFSRTRSLLLLR